MRRSGFFAVALPVACLLVVGPLAGCAAQPSRRPLQTSPIATGAGTTESVRKQLEGTWSLVSFTVFDAAGASRLVEASGSLRYDAFGNLDLTGKLADPASPHASALLFKGRAVVDAAGQRIVLTDIEGNVDPAALPPQMAPDKVRHYAFENDRLSLETRDGARVLARTVWTKVR